MRRRVCALLASGLLVSTGATTKAQGNLFSVPVDAVHAAEMLRAGTVHPAIAAEENPLIAQAMVSADGS